MVRIEDLNIIIGNNQPIDVLSKDVRPWKISRGKLSAHLIFFDRISYYSGYIPDDIAKTAPDFLADTKARARTAPYWKLTLPNDPAFDLPGLVVRIFSRDPFVSAARAIIEKLEDGFNSVQGERWICHPEVIRSDFAALHRHPLAPSINARFLDGIVCPPDSVQILEVLEFREKRAAEREAFFDALYRTCESVEVSGKRISVNVDVDRIDLALSDLNRSAISRWASAIKRSFEFDVRPNAQTMAHLIGACASYTNFANLGSDIATGTFGTLALSVSLVPKIHDDDGFTKAMSYALNAKSTLK